MYSDGMDVVFFNIIRTHAVVDNTEKRQKTAAYCVFVTSNPRTFTVEQAHHTASFIVFSISKQPTGAFEVIL